MQNYFYNLPDEVQSKIMQESRRLPFLDELVESVDNRWWAKLGLAKVLFRFDDEERQKVGYYAWSETNLDTPSLFVTKAEARRVQEELIQYEVEEGASPDEIDLEDCIVEHSNGLVELVGFNWEMC